MATLGNVSENLTLQTFGKLYLRQGNRTIDLLEELETLKKKIKKLELNKNS